MKNDKDIKIFFEQKGYIVNDEMNWFTDKDIFIANEIDNPNSEFAMYKKKAVIYKQGKVLRLSRN